MVFSVRIKMKGNPDEFRINFSDCDGSIKEALERHLLSPYVETISIRGSQTFIFNKKNMEYAYIEPKVI